MGALLSLTGNWSSLGLASKALLEIAAADANAMFQSFGMPTRVRVLVEDTRLAPEEALQKLNSLRTRGVRIVIGPQSSAEMAALKPFADNFGMLLVSQGSTASSLSLVNDNVLRFVPDDSTEADALIPLLQSDGIRGVVPVWRGDAGNDGLETSTRRLFLRAGGTVSQGIRYSATTANFSTVVSQTAQQLSQLVQSFGVSGAGVYLAAFDEAALLFAEAAKDPLLSSVRWYGSDGVAQSAILEGDQAAARFASRVGFPCPILGLTDAASTVWQPLVARLRQEFKLDPDAFAMAAYDAFGVALLASVLAGPSSTVDSLRAAFVRTANSYYGATGWTTLNGAGDRVNGEYDFWSLSDNSGKISWARTAHFSPGTNGGGTLRRVTPGGDQPPVIAATGVANAASFASGILVPGGLVTIFGRRLSQGVTGVVTAPLPLPAQINGTRVLMDGLAAPVHSIVNQNGQEQITVQTPFSLAGKTQVGLLVTTPSGISDLLQVPMMAVQPGIFAAGNGGGVILRPDGSLATPTNPAVRGESITIYLTAMGLVTNAPASGEPTAVELSVITPAVVDFGGIQAVPSYAGLAPGTAGVYQVRVTVPANLAPGAVLLRVVQSATPSNPVTLTVR